MPSSLLVIESLKMCVKARLTERSWTYQHLADAVGCSEVTIKRWMTADDLSLTRIGRVAEALGYTAFELLRMAEVGEEPTFVLPESVEEALARDPDAHLAWDALRMGRDPEHVRVHYEHTAAEWFRLLGRLEALNLLERHAEGRVRKLHFGIHNWLHNGPLGRRHKATHLTWVGRAFEGDGSVVQAATRVVGEGFYDDAELELRAMARRWRDRAWRDQVAAAPERQRRVRWMLVLANAPDWPEI